MHSPIVTCRMNGVDRTWRADSLARIADHPSHRIEERLARRWKVLRKADVSVTA